MNNSASDDGEPTSFVEKTKNLYGKHKGKILATGAAVGCVALAAVVVVAKQAMEQDAEDAEDIESVTDPAAEDERRKTPVKHPVAGHTRTLADGRIVPVAGYERGRSSDEEDEEPGEAAA